MKTQYTKSQNPNRLNPGLRALVPLLAAGVLWHAPRAAAGPVVFQVNMAVSIASGAFAPQNGDTVSVAGTFQGGNPWTAGVFILTNVPGTEMYQGTYNDANAAGTLEGYKFIIDSVSQGSVWEEDFGKNSTGNNRIFTAASGAQTLPPVYFNDLAPSSGVHTSPVVFEVDMSVQLTNGNFNPGDTVEARGTFQTPAQWAGGFILTNSAAQPNIYKGTYPDGNYAGSYEGYKFVIVSGGNDTWESTPNHGYTLQAGGQVLPVLYFGGEAGPTTPVVFQVDMSVEVLLGNFTPGSDYVEARGSFQNPAWSAGFLLSNNPLAANPYLYSGSYADAHGAGTVETYKLIVDGWNWEQPLSTGGNDRTFTLTNATQTLPAVFFSDISSAIPVTFMVDMGPQMASGNFDPVYNGDVIEARGSFNGWYGGFVLTNVPGTTIYQNTWLDTTDPAGEVGQYKFFIAHNGNDYDPNGYEALANNRSFAVTGNAIVLPLVYYSDQAPATGGTNSVTFQVNMSFQISLGNFQPTLGDYVSVAGTFQSGDRWTLGVFQLTNSGGGGIYTGTYTSDGSYPGSQEEYLFIITHNDGSFDWETIPNREFTLTNGMVLPVVYFDNISGAIPVVFQVDMSEQILCGLFTPGYDYVEARGSFQGLNAWSGGFTLTNNPTAANTNLYTGIYLDPNGAGTVEDYKFIVDGWNWEQPVSTGGFDRTFTVAPDGQTLPAVYFSDLGPANTLTRTTTVTFTVNMANAYDINGVAFDPANDDVIINGNFTTPEWYSWTDPDLGISDDTQYILNNDPVGSSLYSGTFVIPTGSPLEVIYKYGIIHNAGYPNTDADNEPPNGQNHIGYILGAGAYSFPVDTFGTLRQQSVISAVVAPDATLKLPAAFNPNGDQLACSLAAGAPAGASVNPTNGFFIWQPGRAYASTTNYITVNVTDETDAALSAENTIVVIVSDYAEAKVGFTAVQSGTSGSVPITLASSDGVTNLEFTLGWPGRLSNPVLTGFPANATGSVLNQGSNLVIQVWTLPGQVFTGSNQIAQLNFLAATNQAPALVGVGVPTVLLPLPVSGVAATKPDATAYVNNLASSSGVVVVGTTALMSPLSSSGGRNLEVFAPIGSEYALQYTTNLTSPIVWTTLTNYTQHALQQSFILDAGPPFIFYQLPFVPQ